MWSALSRATFGPSSSPSSSRSSSSTSSPSLASSSSRVRIRSHFPKILTTSCFPRRLPDRDAPSLLLPHHLLFGILLGHFRCRRSRSGEGTKLWYTLHVPCHHHEPGSRIVVVGSVFGWWFQGLRNGGGIGDVLRQPSSKDPLFMVRVLYDILFFFIVIIIVLNLIFGVIIDTFADLRWCWTKLN